MYDLEAESTVRGDVLMYEMDWHEGVCFWREGSREVVGGGAGFGGSESRARGASSDVSGRGTSWSAGTWWRKRKKRKRAAVERKWTSAEVIAESEEGGMVNNN
jgi:hypothetical protein